MKKISLVMMFVLVGWIASAQQKVTVKGGADLVSAYIWRGSYNAGASFQPALSANVAGFTLGAWGSTDFGKGKKEVDLSLSYSIKGITLGVTDYWWEGEGVYKYFRYGANETAHRWEANLSYQLPFEKFPLALSWNTMFAGADLDAEGKRCYSTYVELLYPFAVGKLDMNAFVGATPWHSPSILPSENKGFSVCNVGVGASYALKCTDSFSIPLFSRLIFNPATEDIHFVFGLSLHFSNN